VCTENTKTSGFFYLSLLCLLQKSEDKDCFKCRAKPYEDISVMVEASKETPTWFTRLHYQLLQVAIVYVTVSQTNNKNLVLPN